MASSTNPSTCHPSSTKTNQAFDLFSNYPKSAKHHLYDLSNVDEKSFFSSDPELPDQEDIQEFLIKIREIDDREKEVEKQLPRKSRRLQDQEIIVVEEEGDIGSNLGANESIIIEHIDFAPREEEEQEMTYVINFVAEQSPPWLIKHYDNHSNSSPYDLESLDFNLDINRYSKNTCFDQIRKRESAEITNKSCIEKHVRFNDEPLLSKHSTQQNIEKTATPAGDKGRRTSADFFLQRDAKFCRSKYKEDFSDEGDRERSQENRKDVLTQTLQVYNKSYFNDQINSANSKNQRLSEELLRLREAHYQSSATIAHLKSTIKDQQVKRGVIEQILSRNRELEKQLSSKNENVIICEEKIEQLEKKLKKTLEEYNLERPCSRGKLSKLETFGLEDEHEECKKQVEQLQERIFDLEQRMAGIEMEVEKRVVAVSEVIEKEVRLKLNEECKMAREEASKCQQAFLAMEFKCRQEEERWERKDKQILDREKEVSRMYDELINNWKDDNESEDVISPNHKPNSLHQQSLTHIYKSGHIQIQKYPKTPALAIDRLTFARKVNNNSVSYISPWQNRRECLDSEKLSVGQGKPKFGQAYMTSSKVIIDQNWERRQKSKSRGRVRTEAREKCELTAINNKIQKLRKEIDRELCSIH